MNWSDVVIAVVAAYGAILSTYTVIAKYMASKSAVRVGMSSGFSYEGNTTSPPLLFVSAGNVGQKNVTLVSWGIELPDKTTLISPNPAFRTDRLPHELLPGRSVQVGNYIKETARSAKEAGFSGVIKLRGFYRDAVGDRYRSKPFSFNISEWIRDADDRVNPTSDQR